RKSPRNDLDSTSWIPDRGLRPSALHSRTRPRARLLTCHRAPGQGFPENRSWCCSLSCKDLEQLSQSQLREQVLFNPHRKIPAALASLSGKMEMTALGRAGQPDDIGPMFA